MSYRKLHLISSSIYVYVDHLSASGHAKVYRKKVRSINLICLAIIFPLTAVEGFILCITPFICVLQVKLTIIICDVSTRIFKEYNICLLRSSDKDEKKERDLIFTGSVFLQECRT